MRQLVLPLDSPAQIVEVPPPAPKPGGLLVQEAFSAVSVGTERVAAQHGHTSLLQKARARPDQVRQVIESIREVGWREARQRVREALSRWNTSGYSCSGVVRAVGSEVSEFRVGDRVACGGGGYATHGESCFVPRRLAVKVPDAVGLDEAALTTIGAIAMQGVRRAELAVGERVAVIGLGIIGQLCCQIARAAGALVTGVDLVDPRVELAERLGAADGLVLGSAEPETRARSLTNGRGYDAVILAAATRSSEPIRLAAQISRDRGRLVVVGDVGLELDRQPLYDRELDLRLSRSYGPGRYDPSYEERGIDYPFGHVRWTEQRNMESFLDLIAAGAVKMAPLITHRFAVEEAREAFDLVVDPGAEEPLGVLLSYPVDQAPAESRVLRIRSDRPAPAQSAVGIGFVGAGAFARSVLLPAMRDLPLDRVGIVASTGTSATQLAHDHGFEWVATDFEELLGEERITALVIATRHDTHADYAARAARAGKAVFVEKPLALSLEELQAVAEAQRETQQPIMVGFNRRFAPFIKEILEFFGPEHGPLMVTVRVNAGALKDHWSLLPEAGGGRILGEACHFVDLIQFLCGSPLETVYADALRPEQGRLEENVCATLRCDQRAVGSLNYNALGDPSVPKEYVEVFGDGKVAVVNDFQELRLSRAGKTKVIRSRQDKGHRQELAAFCNALLEGAPCPLPFEESVRSTLATLALLESCRSGEPVRLAPVSVVEN